MDLKGFEHLGVAWSWPEFREPDGLVLAPAHAWERDGLTRCGAPWPHTTSGYRPERMNLQEYLPDIVPKRKRIEEIRDAEDRTKYLCSECLGRTTR